MGATALIATLIAMKDFSRALANPSLSRRVSLSKRVTSFFRNAKRLMWVTLIIIALFGIAQILFGFCVVCAQYVWAVVPVFIGICGVYFCRMMIISIQVSWKARFHAQNSGMTVQILSSKERTVDGGGGGELPQYGQSEKRLSASYHRQRNKHANKKKTRLKNMSAVQEADYEGTVVMTHVDGIPRFAVSVVSHIDEGHDDDAIAEESVEQSGTNPEQELSALSEDHVTIKE